MDDYENKLSLRKKIHEEPFHEGPKEELSVCIDCHEQYPSSELFHSRCPDCYRYWDEEDD